MLTGFDIEAGAICTFEFDKIIKWLPVPEEHRNCSTGKLRSRGTLRRRLASARFPKAGTDDQCFGVGFTGKIATIVEVHRHGLRGRPSLRAKALAYANANCSARPKQIGGDCWMC